MMLKKQTVWLLTMLSLVVVLSIYYILSPENKTNNNVAQVNQNQEQKQEEADKGKEDNKTNITNVTGDEAFEIIRMQLADERSKEFEQLQIIAASTELTAEERSEARDEMNRISDFAEKEKMLETLIVSNLGYEDALVQADESAVKITVKGHEPSKTKANEIVRMVQKETGITMVNVAFHTENEEN
ncbi:SpoIIIAH-like family protein [Bacillus kwashiorkori]|uniref:SpoIIIAH-like family protein n=1 Tax=Bacillus kwashiorkori TaxID=1522318 RepID=UPI0007824354|nr:SpoIIIAH-like family protein [Bacillus kwashiorkori]